MEGTAVPMEPVEKEQPIDPVAEEIIIEAGDNMEHVIEEEGCLEEIVTTDEVYDENGELVQYEVYTNENNQEICEVEEYVQMGEEMEGEVYMMTDENGETRIFSIEEIRALEASGHVFEEMKADPKDIELAAPLIAEHQAASMKKMVVEEEEAEAGTSSSDMYKSRSSNMPSQYSRMPLETDHSMAIHGMNNDLVDFEDALPSYLREKFVRCLSKTNEQARKPATARVNMRSVLEKRLLGQGSSRDSMNSYMYLDNGQYLNDSDQVIGDTLEEAVQIEDKIMIDPTKSVRSHLNDLAKVEVEKNRESLRPKHASLAKPYFPRGARKDGGSDSRRIRLMHPTNNIPVMRDTTVLTSLKQIRNMVAESNEDFEMPVSAKGDLAPLRYNCPECELGVSSLEKLCSHLHQMHDAPTHVRQVEFYSEIDFERFMNKIELGGCNAEEEERRVDRKFSKVGNSQFYKCNYMCKERGSLPEMAEISLQSHAIPDEPEETCPAFVIKFHNYESIRVKYCDYHIHFDGVVDFRVPILAKRRIFELLYKRLPIPVMQAIISRESDLLSTPGSKSQIRLKNITINETTAILSSIHGSLKASQLQDLRNAHPDMDFDPAYSRMYRNGEKVQPDEKTLILTIEKAPPKVKNDAHDEEVDVENVEDESRVFVTSEDMSAQTEHKVGKEADPSVSNREEDVDVTNVHEDDHHNMLKDDYNDQLDMSVDELYLYDPLNNRDALVEELSAEELRSLEIYESDCEIELSAEQKENRMRMRIKFLIDTLSQSFLELDTHTHALLPSEHRKSTLEELKHYATAVLDIACGLEAEVHCATTMSSNLEAMKRNLISAVSSKERRYYTSDKIGMGRRRTHHQLLAEAEAEAEQQGDNSEEIYSRISAMAPNHRTMGINTSGTFTLPNQDERASPPQLGEVIQPRAVNPWFAKHQQKAHLKRRQDFDDVAYDRPQARRRPKQSRKFAELTTKEVLESNLEALMKDPIAVREDIMSITTDDNVPNAIAMGVDQEIEITTEEVVPELTSEVPDASEEPVPSASDSASASASQEPDQETSSAPQEVETEVEVGTIREEKVMTTTNEEIPENVPDFEGEEEVEEGEAPIQITRTGRVVKQKKWLD